MIYHILIHESSKLGHIMYNQITIEYIIEIDHVKHVSQKLYMYNTSFKKICISTEIDIKIKTWIKR